MYIEVLVRTGLTSRVTIETGQKCVTSERVKHETMLISCIIDNLQIMNDIIFTSSIFLFFYFKFVCNFFFNDE